MIKEAEDSTCTYAVKKRTSAITKENVKFFPAEKQMQ